jgi:hypothetical protein
MEARLTLIVLNKNKYRNMLLIFIFYMNTLGRRSEIYEPTIIEILLKIFFPKHKYKALFRKYLLVL